MAAETNKEKATLEDTADRREKTRQAIIDSLKQKGYALMPRSAWHALRPQQGTETPDWAYTDIVIHHAGHSYVCTFTQEGMARQMREIQDYDVRKQGFDDAGYHYAISCGGWIVEARDIRYKGQHVRNANTGKIGIVLLEDLAEPGEAWKFEYQHLPFAQKIWDVPGIVRDQTAPQPKPAPKTQTDALAALIATLKEFFDIKALGGHREYQLLAPGHLGRACPGTFGMSVVVSMRAKFKLPPPSK